VSIYCTYCTDNLSGYCRSTTLYKREAISSLAQPPFPMDSTATIQIHGRPGHSPGGNVYTLAHSSDESQTTRS
jgi:hypothetical protein